MPTSHGYNVIPPNPTPPRQPIAKPVAVLAVPGLRHPQQREQHRWAELSRRQLCTGRQCQHGCQRGLQRGPARTLAHWVPVMHLHTDLRTKGQQRQIRTGMWVQCAKSSTACYTAHTSAANTMGACSAAARAAGTVGVVLRRGETANSLKASSSSSGPPPSGRATAAPSDWCGECCPPSISTSQPPMVLASEGSAGAGATAAALSCTS